jgi:hypothetical protein
MSLDSRPPPARPEPGGDLGWRSAIGSALAKGFLAIEEDEGPPTYLSEPDEKGIVVILSATFVTFTPLTEDGVLHAIQVDVGGEPRDRLVRPAE